MLAKLRRARPSRPSFSLERRAERTGGGFVFPERPQTPRPDPDLSLAGLDFSYQPLLEGKDVRAYVIPTSAEMADA